eukprot:464724_1
MCIGSVQIYKTFLILMSTLTHLRQRLFRRPSVEEILKWNAQSTIANAVNIEKKKQFIPDQPLDNNSNEKTSNMLPFEISEKKSNVEVSLKRNLTLMDIISYSLGSIIGAGIYVLAGTAGRNYAGGALVISMILGGISQGFTDFALAEFASRCPAIGSSHMYTFLSSGEFLASLFAFDAFIRRPLSSSIALIGIVGYIKSFLNAQGISISDDNIFFGTTILGTSWLHLRLGGMIIAIFKTIPTFFNIKLASTFLNCIVVFNVSLILFFVVTGSFLTDPDYWRNPCDYTEYGNECPSDANNSFMPYGIQGVFAATGITKWAFGGAQGAVILAEECVNPIRDIPRAIYLSLLIVGIIYVGVALVVMGMVPFQSLDEVAPFSDAFLLHDESVVAVLCSLGALFNVGMSAIAGALYEPRNYYKLAFDGFIPSCFANINKKSFVPINGSIYFMIIGGFVATFFDLGTILSFTIVMETWRWNSQLIGVLIMRYAPPSLYNIIKNEWNEYDIASKVGNYIYPKAVFEHGIETVYITPFWTESRVFSFFWSLYFFALIFGYVMNSQNWFYHQNLEWLWICLIVFVVFVLFIQTVLTSYFHFSFDWKNWMTSKQKRDIMFMPFGPWSTIATLILNGYIMATYDFIFILPSFIIIISGTGFYFCYGYKHCRLNYTH